jgi:hypothetical protein
VADPLLKHIPQLAETYFTNWTDAQVLWDWFSLLPGSPALGSGPNGRDQGGVIPLGVSISGEPIGTTRQSTATLEVGPNRQGNGIPTSGWLQGSGYTAYEWQLDGGPWSSETAIEQPIALTNLPPGPHQVAVIGKNDAGFYQNDPTLGTNAVITVSRVWTVVSGVAFTSAKRSGKSVTLQIQGEPGTLYAIEFKDSLEAALWSKFTEFTADPQSGAATVTDPGAGGAMRFYRIVTP